MKNEKLHLNNKLISSGGVIGRLDFFFVMIKVIALVLLGLTPLIFDNVIDSVTGRAVLLLMVLPIWYITFINIFKRVRDIRGTTKDELVFKIGAVLIYCTPFLNTLFLLFLLFAKGKVTGQGTAVLDSNVAIPC